MAINCPKPLPSGGIMVAPVVIPAFTVQVKDLGRPGLPPNPSKIRERDGRRRARQSEAERIITAQLESQEQAKKDSEVRAKKGCKIKKDRFCPARPDLWKCVNNGDNAACPPSNSRQTMNSTLTDTRTRKSGPSHRTYTTKPATGDKASHLPFSRFRETDNASYATTDTQKLLAMLKESEGEIEGLSISSSMKADSGKSSTESIFEPIKHPRHGEGFMKVVRKKSSPEPKTRMETRWSRRNDPPPPDPPSPPVVPVTVTATGPCDQSSPTTPDDRWWNKSNVNWRETQPSKMRKNCATGGYGAEHNADALPAIAHLSQLGKINPTAPGAAQDRSLLQRGPPMKPWNSTDTQNYFPKDPSPQNQPGPRGQYFNPPGQPSSKVTESTPSFHPKRGRNHKAGPRQSHSRVGASYIRSGDVMSPSDPEWGASLHQDSKPPAPFATNVFVRDMTKTRNVNLSRLPAMKVITKVPGDPAVIKRTNTVTDGHSATHPGAPASLEASELMQLEEDINDVEQQQDAKRLALFMSADLKDQMFTDVIIKCKDHTYKIHKEFLLAFTSYDMPVIAGEPLRDFPSLDLTDLDSSDVATILHFLYYGELKLSVYNVLGVQATARALGVVDIPPVIQEFHDKLFHSPNLINLIEFAQGKGLEDLYTYSWKLFAASFYDHINGGYFLNWDVKWVLNLLGYEAIPIKSELEVFEAARLWLNYRPEERSDTVKSVLTTIRWTYMTPEEMVECEREDPYLMSRQEAHELVSDANWYKIMIRNGVPWTDFSIPPPRGSPNNAGRMNRLPSRPVDHPSTQTNYNPDFGYEDGGGTTGEHHSGNANSGGCPYAAAQSAQSERGLSQQKSSVLSRDFSRETNGTAVTDYHDHDEADAFRDGSFNSLDVDVSNLSCAGDDCADY